MALSMAQKLKQAAEARMAETAHETNARLNGMDGNAREAVTQLAPFTRCTKTSEPTEASSQTPQQAVSTPHYGTASRQGCSVSQTDTSFQHSKPTRQGDISYKHIDSAEQSSMSTTVTAAVPICLDTPAMVRTPAQKRMLRYFEDHGHHVSNYGKIIAETGLRYGTVRDIVGRFEKQGIISKVPWIQGSARGLLFRFNGVAQQDNLAAHANITKQHDTAAQQFSMLLAENGKKHSISLKTLEMAWPCLARAGFGLDQVALIEKALAEQGKPMDMVVQGLDHAEWELANNAMRDKTGQPVVDPCAWVFRSLAGTGYYRRPAGYVSPAEQAERDTEEEAVALAKSREKARQARFHAWRRSLSADELQNALTGKRAGTDETWLKNVWSKRGEPQ